MQARSRDRFIRPAAADGPPLARCAPSRELHRTSVFFLLPPFFLVSFFFLWDPTTENSGDIGVQHARATRSPRCRVIAPIESRLVLIMKPRENRETTEHHLCVVGRGVRVIKRRNMKRKKGRRKRNKTFFEKGSGKLYYSRPRAVFSACFMICDRGRG